jgi:Transglutaminase-like superfamily
MRLLFLSVLIFFAVSGLAQESPYAGVDSLMRGYNQKIKSADELYKVVYYIRNNFEADSLRLRASIIWITENIAYDVKAYEKEDPSAAQLIYVVKNKKAICSGYASLVKFFCNSFNIECEIVNGYGRAGKNKIVMNQTYLRSNHAWNSIKVNGTWRLVDATWAAGVVDDSDEDNLVYRKRFNETYYDTPPEKMILNHLPEQKQFQLTNKRMDQRKFMKSPLYTSEFLSHDISAVLPDTALIRTKTGDTLIFKLKTELPLKYFSAFSDNLEKATYHGPATFKDGWIEFRYPVRLLGFYNLYIGYYLNNLEKYTLLAYKLEVK